MNQIIVRALGKVLLLAALAPAAVVAQTTTTTLSPSANPSTYGTSVTLTATVSRTSDSSAPGSGTVTFKNGSATIGTGAVAAGVAAFATNQLPAGSLSLTAVYGGITGYTTSTSSALSQTVSTATTTTTLTVTPSSPSLGQNVTMVARITGLAPTGTVTFKDGATTLGTSSVSAGAASLSISSLAAGSHSLTAVYSGDTNLQTSTSSAASTTVGTRPAMTWQYGYDALGRMNTVVDGNALPSYIIYDSLGRPVQTQQPANVGAGSPTVIDMAYNLSDGLTSVTDPRSLATTYTPTGLGTTVSQSSPDTGTTTFTYDAKGNVLTAVDARSKTTTYTWDNIDRLTGISYTTGTATAFEYDGGSSPTAAEKGELTKITDESGNTTYVHDAMGRLTTKTVTIGAKTFTVTYAWGNSGTSLDKLTAITYPSGSRANYSYNSKGDVSGITVNPVNANGVGVSGSATTLMSSVTYSAENAVTGWLWSDSTARTIGYDSNGLIDTYTLGNPSGTSTAAGSLRTITRDAAGRITGYTHTNSGSPVSSLTHGFAYDDLDRLLTSTVNSASTSYVYDATGNRLSKTISATTYTNTVSGSSNKLTQIQDVGGTSSVTHDAAGHMTGDGTNTFTYNDRGRMSSATSSAGTVNYKFNGLNQRTGKSGAVTAFFVYDEQGQLLGEYDSNGSPVYETIYLGMMPTGVLKQTGTAGSSNIAVTIHNVSADHIATPRLITRQDHTIVWRWDTAEAFGGTAPDQNPSSVGTFTFNQRFPGQVFDAETGLFQNWNREYNARTGRYIQSDPIGLDGGINTYLYVNGLPVMMIDLEGLAGYIYKKGGIHHQMPNAVARDMEWSPSAVREFDNSLFNPPLMSRRHDREADLTHARYNKEVTQFCEDWATKNKVDPKNATVDDARKLMYDLRYNSTPSIMAFNRSIWMRSFLRNQYWFRPTE